MVQCKIFYEADGINAKFDRKLEKLLREFGYTRWASGYDHTNNIRDLAFEKEENNAKNKKEKENTQVQRRR